VVTEKHIQRSSELLRAYSEVHLEIKLLEEQVAEIYKRKEEAIDRLTSIREEERLLLADIKAETGRDVNIVDLFQQVPILKKH
jgi:septation ring formation regulator EzrA